MANNFCVVAGKFSWQLCKAGYAFEVVAALWATHFGGLNPPELFPIFGSGAAGLCLSGISLQNDILARSEEQNWDLELQGVQRQKNCLFIFIAGNIAGKCRQTGFGTIHLWGFPWTQPTSAAQLGSDETPSLGLAKLQNKFAKLQSSKGGFKESIYLQRAFRKLLRNTTWRIQTALLEIKAVGSVAKGLTGATWAPEQSAGSWGGSWKIVCRLGESILEWRKENGREKTRVKKVFAVLSQLEGCSHQSSLVISLLSGHWCLEYKPHHHNAH